MNPCPYMVFPWTPVPLVFNLFRTMGLRHLIVINTKGQVIEKAIAHNEQLLEVEHDIINYQNRGLCYLPKPKAEADNTDTRF